MSFSSDATPLTLKSKIKFFLDLEPEKHLWTELLAREVIELAKTYTIIQDLDSLRSNYNTRSFDSKSSAFKTSSSQFNRPSTQTLSHRNNIKGKSFERDYKNNGPEFHKVNSKIKCYKC